jgi:hypothetical protein
LSEEPVVCSVCRQVAEHPEYRGTCWWRKDKSGVGMSWSATLLQVAGGFDRLIAEWEPEK